MHEMAFPYATIPVAMISAVVLTHNSESSIRETLLSLTWCDEIVVIDDASDDDTVLICRSLGARVVSHGLQGDFAAQRNFGLTQAKGDWILFVDADEHVSLPLAQEIRIAIQDRMKDGYTLRRLDTMWGVTLRHGEISQVRLVRLGRKGAGVWVRPVHEVWQVHGYVGTLKTPLLHYPHPDVTQFLRDINDYSTANALYLYEHNVHATLWQVVAYPVAKFIQNYVFRKGFLDGTPGAVVSIMMSFHSFLTRAKLWQLRERSGETLSDV